MSEEYQQPSTESQFILQTPPEPKSQRMFRDAATNDPDFRKALWDFKGTPASTPGKPNPQWENMRTLLINNHVFDVTISGQEALLQNCLALMATIDWKVIHEMEKKLTRQEESLFAGTEFNDEVHRPFSA